MTGTTTYNTCGTSPLGDLFNTDDTGMSSTDNITKLTTLRMTGTCDTSLVTVFVDGISIGDATNYDADCSSPGATYQILTSPALSTLTEGVHAITTVRSNALGILYGAAPVSATTSFTVDTTPPTLTINQAAGQADPANVALMNFTVVFSEAINPASFTAGDITLTGTGTATIGTPTTSDNITWNVPVTATTDGTIIASMTATKVTDVAGNDNTASTSTDNSVTYDTVAPSLTLTRAIGQTAISGSYSIYFSAVFIEAIDPASFTTGDVTLSGTGTGTVTSVSQINATTFGITVNVLTIGTFILNITTNKYSDPAGNSNITTALSPTVEIVAGG